MSGERMDPIDQAQQDAIEELHRRADENERNDSRQQSYIDNLQNNNRVMFWILVINTIASMAQILECIKVWVALK